jgi:hypothetical protein
MRSLWRTVGSGFFFVLALNPASAQQVDMAVVSKWTSADVIRYHVVGEYQGSPAIASDGSGLGDVTDRVEIDLTWKLSGGQMVGAPTFKNYKSAVANLHDREKACLPPVLKGAYEHYELTGVKDGLGGALEMQVQTTYPAVEVAQSCRASRKTVPAKVMSRTEDLAVPSPVMFGMPVPDSDQLRISADRKSLIHKKGGWTWTFTPSVAPRN